MLSPPIDKQKIQKLFHGSQEIFSLSKEELAEMSTIPPPSNKSASGIVSALFKPLSVYFGILFTFFLTP